MAVRASVDNLAFDQEVEAGAPVPDFSELWEHRPAIQRLCEAMVGASNAEDVVQDTYLRALNRGGRLERRDSTEPWLATVARRRSLDELRARRHLVFLPAPPEPSAAWSDDPAQRIVDLELIERLHTAIDRLTERERRVLLRQVGEGLSLDEIALCERTSVASVRSVLSRARRKLRSSLERAGMLAGLRWRASEVVGPRAARWLAPLDAALPMVAGAGWELGRRAAAAVVAILALFGSSVPRPPATVEALGDPPAAAVVGPGGEPAPGGGGAGKRPSGPRPTPSGSPLVPTVPFGPSVPVAPPGLSDGGAQPEDAQITSLVAAADGRTVLAGGLSTTTGTWVLYRSSDGGQTWSRLGTDSLVSPDRHPAEADSDVDVLLAPRYPLDPRVFLANGTFLHRSVDGGRTFSPVAPLRGSAVLSPRFSSGDARLFAAGPPPAVFHDDDDRLEPMASMPWTGSGGIAIGPRFATDGEVFVGGTVATAADVVEGALFVCRASACTRRSLVPGLSGAPEVLVSRAGGGVVFAWKSDAVYRSIDDGHTFTRHPTPAGVAVNRLVESQGRIFLLGTRIGTDGDAFYVSANGGATWAAIGRGSPLQVSVAAVTTLGRGRMVAAPLGVPGVLCSDDGGGTWRPRCGR